MKPREFIDIMEQLAKLRDTTRHCYTPKGRHESVAEHTYRIALLAFMLKDEMPDIDTDKVIKMCLIHDLGEAFTGDIPSFDKKESDEELEMKLLYEWVDTLPDNLPTTFRTLYEEMEALETKEAKLYKALDNLDAIEAHNESELSTWIPLEYELNLTYANERVKFSDFLTKVREELKEDTLKKIEEGRRN